MAAAVVADEREVAVVDQLIEPDRAQALEIQKAFYGFKRSGLIDEEIAEKQNITLLSLERAVSRFATQVGQYDELCKSNN